MNLLVRHINIASTHAQRMTESLDHISTLFPVTADVLSKLEGEKQAYLEVFINRFAKLQDTVGSKIFPALVETIGETVKGSTFLDLLNHLEKIEIIPSVNFWMDLRKVRNFVSHEYPDDFEVTAKHVNEIHVSALQLLNYWRWLHTRMDEMLAHLELN